MSYWVLPTPADYGIRAFAQNPNELFREVTLGMQSILLTDNFDINGPVRKTAHREVHGDIPDELLKLVFSLIKLIRRGRRSIQKYE